MASITIPEGVTEIGGYTFLGCSSLKSITIPNSVTYIGNRAFQWCSSLESITIPDSVTYLGPEGVFEDCSSLKSVTISNSVTSIMYDAFEGCSSLESIIIPDSVTVIYEGAFTGCSSLESIIIPDSVTEIGETTFTGCDNLTIYGNEGSYAQTYAKENNIPFKLLADSPSEGTENPAQPTQPSTPKYEVTLTAGNTSITNSKMQDLVNTNKTHDVVIHSTNGVVFTFPKGTMKMVDDKDSYDFGVRLTTDYTQVTYKPFAQEDFAFEIDYNYEGDLPGTALISIPVDKKWIGKALYYYRVSNNGKYTYLTSAVVDKNGIFTISQNHCSDYVAVAKKIGSPETGDADMTWVVVLAFVSVAGVLVTKRKMMAR